MQCPVPSYTPMQRIHTRTTACEFWWWMLCNFTLTGPLLDVAFRGSIPIIQDESLPDRLSGL